MMRLLAKIRTTLRLVSRGEWAVLRRQWSINTAHARVRRHRGRPFVNRDLGFPSVCHPDWPDSHDQFLSCDGDKWEFSLLAAWLREGDVCFDLGANLGLYSCAALSAVGRTGRVIAVDADPFVIERLGLTGRLLGSPPLQPVHAAITPEDGTVTFHVQVDRTLTGAQSLRPNADQLAGSTAVTVPACRFQSVADRWVPNIVPSLVKIDIEGAEDGALATAPQSWFGADGPLWIVEVNPSALARFGIEPRAITSRFMKERFAVWLVPKHPRSGLTDPALRPLLPTEPFTDSVYYNLIAIPRGARGQQRAPGLRRLLPRALE